jgi:hypothetical protein
MELAMIQEPVPMSLCLLVPLSAWLAILPGDTLVLSIFGIVVLYLVARWVGRRRAEQGGLPDPRNEAVRYLIRSTGANAGEHFGASEGLTLTRFSFRDTDAQTGPPDAEDFYDELLIELRDSKSGQTWKNSIHVTTPKGLDRIMAEEQWDSVIGTELLIVRRYELNTILQGAIDHLQEIYEAQVQIAGKGFASGQPPS